MNYASLTAFGNFLLYICISCAMLALFTRVYIWLTPYNETDQMRKGMVAPATALAGAMIGFTLPMLAVSYIGANVIEFIAWSLVAMAVQLVLFKVLYRIIPAEIEVGNQAVAIFFAGMAVCVGAINAFSLIPH
jgi:putative membrane protein